MQHDFKIRCSLRDGLQRRSCAFSLAGPLEVKAHRRGSSHYPNIPGVRCESLSQMRWGLAPLLLVLEVWNFIKGDGKFSWFTGPAPLPGSQMLQNGGCHLQTYLPGAHTHTHCPTPQMGRSLCIDLGSTSWVLVWESSWSSWRLLSWLSPYWGRSSLYPPTQPTVMFEYNTLNLNSQARESHIQCKET